jgi:hypothetical protein
MRLKHLRYRAPPHDPIEGLPVQQDASSSLKTIASAWSQPVAKTRPRCDIDGIEVIAKPTDCHPTTAAA